MKLLPNIITGTTLGIALAMAGCSSSGNGRENEDDVGPVITTNPDSLDDDHLTDLDDPDAECSVGSLNQWVDANMRDYYYYYDQVPELDLSLFESPENLIEALRYEPNDIYSYVSDKRETTAFFEEGKYFGFGYSVALDDDNKPRLEFVFEDSQAGRAGLKRGDILLSLNGTPWQDLTRDFYYEAIGTDENPLAVTLGIEDGASGEQFEIELINDDVYINSVLHSSIITNRNSGTKIGYLAFQTFIETSTAEINSAIDFFNESGIDELVLDLRYNGGGRSSIAYALASQIAGPTFAGQTLITRVHNDKYSDRNHTIEFPENSRSLDLSRVVVLQTESTASASELVINGLKPYIEVVTLGEQTTGKSFSSYPRDNCDKVMSAIEAERVNANEVSVFGGIVPDCAAEDDLTRDFGINRTDDGASPEGMLLSALEYINDGSCQTPSRNARINVDTRANSASLVIGNPLLPGGDIVVQ